MKDGPDIARLASLIGDPARANMLTRLMTDQALTASELALESGVTAQTASSHLRKLEDGGLVRQRRQGRHRYFALAGDEVGHALEALMGLAAGAGHVRTRPGPRDEALRDARICYSHLAGRAGARLFARLVETGRLRREAGTLVLTPGGEALAEALGVDVAALRRQRAPLCRECLDWSERRPHLAGSLGRAILARIEALGWARRDPNSRAVLFTEAGRRKFEDLVQG